ncbi:hypothetical protein J6590_091460 [Homalodisca vitripennis]|nr:hypothetical protein J6590_091460 [Homalodisca vitripennis]
MWHLNIFGKPEVTRTTRQTGVYLWSNKDQTATAGAAGAEAGKVGRGRAGVAAVAAVYSSPTHLLASKHSSTFPSTLSNRPLLGLHSSGPFPMEIGMTR